MNMKKYLSYILTAALLIAALAVPASATAVVSESVPEASNLNDVYLNIKMDGELVAVADISNHFFVEDGILASGEAAMIARTYIDQDLEVEKMFVQGVGDVTEVTDLYELRAEGEVQIYISVVPLETDGEENISGSISINDARGYHGDTVDILVRMSNIGPASSVGIKYTLPESVEFVSAQWLLSGGVLESATSFGAAYAWSEAQRIDSDVLQLTVRIREDAPMQFEIPLEIVVKDVDTTIISTSMESTVWVNYPINDFWMETGNCNVGAGDTFAIAYHLEPESMADQIQWYSTDDEVATVENGIVTAVAPGTARIIAQLEDWWGECTVTVFEESGAERTAPCLYTGEEGCVKHIKCIVNNLFG